MHCIASSNRWPGLGGTDAFHSVSKLQLSVNGCAATSSRCLAVAVIYSDLALLVDLSSAGVRSTGLMSRLRTDILHRYTLSIHTLKDLKPPKGLVIPFSGRHFCNVCPINVCSGWWDRAVSQSSRKTQQCCSVLCALYLHRILPAFGKTATHCRDYQANLSQRTPPPTAKIENLIQVYLQ